VDVNTLREDVSTLREDVSTLREDVSTLREDVSTLREDVNTLREDVNKLRSEVAALRAFTEKGFRTIDRRMERQIGEFEKLHAYRRDLEDRFDKLEKLSGP
jgi:predicted  nucleic acid-binding Zn-ribbon protein